MFSKLKKISLYDVFGFLVLSISFPIAMVMKIATIKKPIWLVCELKETARDNGYHFFKYVREKHPECNCYYAISTNCSDYNNVKEYGNIIKFGSLKHWIYYMAAKYNISSHKEGNPNHLVFSFIHRYLKLLNNRVFLQHGITKDDAKMFYYKNSYFKFFICGAKKEYEYVTSNFGYPKGNVVYTGFARFDNLYGKKSNPKKVLITPTWRRWLAGANETDFCDSDYYKTWNSLINNEVLLSYFNKNDIVLYFYPHYQFRKFVKYFNSNSKCVKILDSNYVNIQEMLIDCSLLITDYSSVYMDFAYMRKPIIYFQFDYDKYRESHFAKGYFNYTDDGFGKVLYQEKDVVNNIIKYCQNNYEVDKKYHNRMNSFFELYDSNNCERIFNILIQE